MSKQSKEVFVVQIGCVLYLQNKPLYFQPTSKVKITVNHCLLSISQLPSFVPKILSEITQTPIIILCARTFSPNW